MITFLVFFLYQGKYFFFLNYCCLFVNVSSKILFFNLIYFFIYIFKINMNKTSGAILCIFRHQANFEAKTIYLRKGNLFKALLIFWTSIITSQRKRARKYIFFLVHEHCLIYYSLVREFHYLGLKIFSRLLERKIYMRKYLYAFLFRWIIRRFIKL